MGQQVYKLRSRAVFGEEDPKHSPVLLVHVVHHAGSLNLVAPLAVSFVACFFAASISAPTKFLLTPKIML